MQGTGRKNPFRSNRQRILSFHATKFPDSVRESLRCLSANIVEKLEGRGWERHDSILQYSGERCKSNQ